MIDSEAEALLREAGLRVTRPRVAVLSTIHDTPHADVGSIVSAVRERLGTVSTQAVYDVLGSLVSASLARRIDLANSPARYELQKHDDHHHAVCRLCGAISDVEVVHAEQHSHPGQGFELDNVEVTYWGTCPDCQTQRPNQHESISAAQPVA